MTTSTTPTTPDAAPKEPRFQFTVSNTTLTFLVTGAALVSLLVSAWKSSIATAVKEAIQEKEHTDMLTIVRGSADKEGLEPKVTNVVRRLEAQGRELALLMEWHQSVKDKEKLIQPPTTPR